jgi:replication factor A1
MPLEEILDELAKKTGGSREDLLNKVNKKYDELSGLLTKEGAAYLVARELGVNLVSESKRKMEIKNIVEGVRNINLIGRIFKISNITEFKKSDGSDGKVANLFIGDSTGYVRLPLWNEQVSVVEEEAVEIGDVIQVYNCLSKENNFGEVEITLGKYGNIRKIEDTGELPSVDNLINRFLVSKIERSRISDLTSGNFEIKGNVVQVFGSNFLFYKCSVCGGTLKEANGKFACNEHGDADLSQNLVVSCVIDDGTGDIRAAFFREVAESACNISATEMASKDKEMRYSFIKEKLLGRELVLSGKVRKNKMFDRLEIIVNECKDLNVLEESKRLVEDLESKVDIGG